MPLELYNTLTKRREPFIPADPSHVTFYTCGPTVYDDAHIGNFRSFLAADLLRRFLESPLCELANETPEQRAHRERHGRRVTHVMNITDVGHMTDDAEGGEAGEDRMAVAGRRLAEAKKSGQLPPDAAIDPRDPFQIARFYERRFREDARKLGLKVSIEAERDESLHPKATANVPGMIEAIQRLLDRGCAYVVGPPGSRVVYFDVQKFPPYGRLSGNTLDNLRAGEGGRVSAENQATKRHPADFLLWKEDPSHIMKWESPWGWGYPGWHIECTAMSVGRLVGAPPAGQHLRTSAPYPGAVIDLHSGGEDNIFPHHECEIAQTCCAYTDSTLSGQFARLWFHPRFLLVEGAKMSKSKGNFYTARDLFDKGIEPAAIRLELIKTHYRSQANFTMQGLADSQRMIERWRTARLEIARRSMAWTSTDHRVIGHLLGAKVAHALHNDMNVAEAIAGINGTVTTALSQEFDTAGLPAWTDEQTENYCEKPVGESRGAPLPLDLFKQVEPIFCVLSLARPAGTQSDIGVLAPGVAPDPVVEDLLRLRRDARSAKDFKASDAIRDQLAAMGLAIKDMPGGRVEVRRA